ncbi:MAG: hypothetical protein HDQ96_00530 [Lachnospiraceae bacterium]|nr:hypothetical protein [Lachnospiraceae bacterium]
MSQENIAILILFIVHLVIGIIVLRTIVLYLIRASKYGGMPPSSESREKMKFVSPFSEDEVIEMLKSHNTNDIFEYEFKKESDSVYILLIKGIDTFNFYCEGKVNYKVVINSESANTVLWLVLAEGDNKKAIERYGWELKGFMEKKIKAVREK